MQTFSLYDNSCGILLLHGNGTCHFLSDEGAVRVTFDDSIVSDTAAEKRQVMDEVAGGRRSERLTNSWSGNELTPRMRPT